MSEMPLSEDEGKTDKINNYLLFLIERGLFRCS